MGRYRVNQTTGELTLLNPSMDDIPIFQGVSGSIVSVSGLVPQAQAGDEDKALLGNGTWGTIAGGGQTISYADWLQLTPEEQSHGDYYIPDYSGSILPAGGFDNVPTAGSQKPVTSNGIYEAIGGLENLDTTNKSSLVSAINEIVDETIDTPHCKNLGVLPNNTNLNDVTEWSVYQLYNNRTYSNIPTGVTWGLLETIPINSIIIQRLSSSSCWYRYYWNSAWDSWKKYTLT